MKFWLISYLFVGLVSTGAFCYKNRDMMVKKFAGGTHKTFDELVALQNRMRVDFMKQLNSLPSDVKQELLKIADQELKGKYELKTATDYLIFFRKGNRNIYESMLHKHTGRITKLVIGQLIECQTNETSVKYMDEIVNGIWIMMEESTWVYPAHLYIEKGNSQLPLPDHDGIDLNAGENVKFVAWIKLLLKDKFDKFSVAINKRIDYELKRRIFLPYLEHNDFFWMGFHSHTVNNWNIWVNGNILKGAMMTLIDEDLFDKVANKTLYSVDYFLNGYGDDGGCDEGPAYWRQAGGRLIEYVEAMCDLYDAKNYFKQQDLIKKIGEYVFKMHIYNNWYVNFADAVPVINYPPSLIAKFGVLFDDDSMKHYAAYVYKFHKDYYKELTTDINEFRNFLHDRQLIETYKPESPSFDYFWFSDIQVFTSRSKTNDKDLFIAGKFGNNHESHNHNDVGNFILYQNGQPVLIDIGVGTYNATTFGSHRYDIFYFQSEYHNCPTINGVTQKEGNYAAKHVHFNVSTNNETLTFSGDISGAYPSNASVNSWVRTIHFDRKLNTVDLNETYSLNKFHKSHELNFIVTNQMQHDKKDYGLLLHNGDVRLNMHFDWNVFQLKIEDRGLYHDHHLTNIWGESIRRIKLVTNEQHKELKGHYHIRFSNDQ